MFLFLLKQRTLNQPCVLEVHLRLLEAVHCRSTAAARIDQIPGILPNLSIKMLTETSPSDPTELAEAAMPGR